MAMRSLWSGAIGFGLVTIPVKLYSAVEDSTLDLDMLDKKDHSHIHFKRVNATTGKEVDWENIVKGYDYKGKYVVLGDKDFEAASPEKTKRIEIFQFVKADEVDSIYFETPYFIEPDKNGARPYALLLQALKKSNKVAVGSFVLRNKEHLAIIRVYKDILVVNQIRFQQELRNTSELKTPAARNIPASELKMAMALIDHMTESFNINKYKDTYTDALMKVIKTKAKGATVKAAPLKVVHRKTTDLMDQLKASLSSKKKRAS